jgi:hypothetical protein
VQIESPTLYSVGHWEGDTLVVESSGFNGKAWLSGWGNPTTDALHLTERIHRPATPAFALSSIITVAAHIRQALLRRRSDL